MSAAPPRHQQAVVISIVVAATAVTACALVAIAWMLGWLPSHAAKPAQAVVSPASSTKPAMSNDLALLPGESVVNAEEAKPVTPQYAAPVAPPPVEAARKPTVSTRQPPRDDGRPRAGGGPVTPTYRAPPPATSYERSARNFCVNCATVTSITAFEMGEWDVHVRFEDGTTQTLRYRTRPSLRIGQSVLLEDGRLIPQ